MGVGLAVREEIKRLEQVWLVLADLFQDLTGRNIKVDVASDLRNCKTLIHFIQTSILHPPKEPRPVDDSLRNLQQMLGRIQSVLVSAALTVDENYLAGWMNKIDRAERAELNYRMIHTTSEFVPSLPKDFKRGWVRLTLLGPIAEEKVQNIAERFGVKIEFQNDLHVVITGGKTTVRKAAQNLYELSVR